MNRQNVALGRIMGIPIGLDYSWFLIFALLTWMLASSYYPAEFKDWPPPLYWIMGGATAIMLFVSVLHRVTDIPRPEWGKTTAAQAMLPLDKVRSVSPDAELWPTLELMDREGVNQLPVMNDRQVVGMLSREDVVTFLRTLQELGSWRTHRRPRRQWRLENQRRTMTTKTLSPELLDRMDAYWCAANQRAAHRGRILGSPIQGRRERRQLRHGQGVRRQQDLLPVGADQPQRANQRHQLCARAQSPRGPGAGHGRSLLKGTRHAL